MAGLPPKPEFSQMPPRFEREDERHYRGSGGGRSPTRRRARSPAVDSYVPGAAGGGGRGRRSGPSSYHRSRSPPPPRRERLDTYRPGGERDRGHDYERERERFDPREREWIPAAQSRRGGGERESWDARNAREKAERLAKEGRQASRRQRDWKTRDEAAAYDRRRRERERSRSPPRRRSYSRRTSPSTSPQTQRSTRQARSPSREETPEEGAVTPEHRKRRRQPSSSRSRSPSTRTRSTRSSASRSRSPAVKKHRLPTSTLKHTSPPTRLAPLPTKPAASTSTAPAATSSLEKPAEASSSSTRVPTPQPAPTSKWPTVPSASTSTAPSPAIPSQTYRDKGKAREDRRDAEGDVRMTDAPAIVVNTPTPTPQSQPTHGLPARPIPTEPARHNQHTTHPDRMKLHDHTDRKPTNSRPIPTQPAASYPSHSKQLPKGPKQRGGSPDPVAIRKRWEQRDMSKEQRERAEKAAENERREYASYQTAMSAYHLKNPSTVSFELRRKLRQATHELVVTLLDSGAAEKRRDVAEAGCERARAGVLGEGVMGSPVQ